MRLSGACAIRELRHATFILSRSGSIWWFGSFSASCRLATCAANCTGLYYKLKGEFRCCVERNMPKSDIPAPLEASVESLRHMSLCLHCHYRLPTHTRPLPPSPHLSSLHLHRCPNPHVKSHSVDSRRQQNHALERNLLLRKVYPIPCHPLPHPLLFVLPQWGNEQSSYESQMQSNRSTQHHPNRSRWERLCCICSLLPLRGSRKREKGAVVCSDVWSKRWPPVKRLHATGCIRRKKRHLNVL